MATIKNLLVLFAVLVSSTLILGQESSPIPEVPSAPPVPSDAPSSNIPDISTAVPHDDSSTTHMASSASGLYGHFPLSNFNWDQIPGASFFGIGDSSRQKRASDYIVLCNFVKEGYSLCTSCHSVRRCFPFNIGLQFRCGGSRPYCRYGRCSEVEGALCPKSSTTVSTSTANDTSAETDSE